MKHIEPLLEQIQETYCKPHGILTTRCPSCAPKATAALNAIKATAAQALGKCETCRFCVPLNDNPNSALTCDNPKLSPDASELDGDYLIPEDGHTGERGYVRVGPKFGCCHWQAAKATC